ncbi:MAG: cadherin-like beta sandwich domain-containing protein, partial [Halobacteriota archaeon]
MNNDVDTKSSFNKRIRSLLVLTVLLLTLIVTISGCIDDGPGMNDTEDSTVQTDDPNMNEADDKDDTGKNTSDSQEDLDEKDLLIQEDDTFTIRVGSGSSSRSSSGNDPATPVTSSGSLELDPTSASNNTDVDITVIYSAGENITDGIVRIAIPSEFTTNDTLDNITIATETQTTVAGNNNTSYDADNMLTIEDLTINKDQEIRLELATQSIDLAGTYQFTANAQSSGKDISNEVTATLTIYNNDAYLKDLTISPSTLDPSFTAGTGNYNASVDYDTEQVNVVAILSDTNADLKVNGTNTSSGDAIPVILNGPGEYTEIAIDVLAEDAISSVNYTINVSRAISPVIQDAGVSITEGSVVFGYAFYNETGALLTYADATTDPYLLNSTASTVTLVNGTGASTDAIPLDSLSIDPSGNVTYQNLTEVADAFSIADIMQWGYPANITLDLSGGQGEYAWTLEETISFTPDDIAAFTSIIPGSIIGQVTNTTGAPLENVFVQLENMGQYNASTDSAGIYTIGNVPAGSYNVTAGIADYMSSTNESVVVLAAQPTTGVDFVLISTDPGLATMQVNPGSLD